MPKKRGRKKKFKLNLDFKPELVRSILAVFFFLSAFLVVLSYFAPGYSVNAFINSRIRIAFGSLAFLLFFPLLLLSAFCVESIDLPFKNLRVFIGMCLTLLSVATFLTVFSWNSNPYTEASSGRAGGMLGYQFFYFLYSSFGFLGAVLVLLGLLTISIILVSNLSLNTIIAFIKKVLLKLKEKYLDLMHKDAIDATEVSSDMAFAESSIGEAPIDTFPAISSNLEGTKPKSQLEILPPFSEPQNGTVVEPFVTEDSKVLTSIAPNLPYADRVWQLPPLSLLDDSKEIAPDAGNVKSRNQIIESTLRSFAIKGTVIGNNAGPAVTQYVLDVPSGTKISKVVNLQSDLARALSSPTGSVRIEAPIPGQPYIGIEVPNNNRVILPFKTLLTSDSMKGLSSKLGIVLGKDVGGRVYVYDIGKMPHLLVAGATGSGKSVFLHSLLFSILFRATPQEVKFILVDPKRVEFTYYDNIPHLLNPVITDVEKAPAVFKWAVIEMERRYRLLESAHARNIDSYNEKSGFQALPYIVIIVDELGEIMVADPAAVEKSIIRLAQLARAVGIHLILSVQRPSTNIITGIIKANIPCRIAFNVSSQIDSRVIIDQPGAEKLLGKGDMLFVPPDASKPLRLQGAWVSEQEINSLVKYLKDQGVEPEYKEEILEMAQKAEQSGTSVSSGGDAVDDLFEEAVEICVSSGKASASLLQRRLSIGYARAARILDELEAKGVIGPQNGSQPREVLVSNRDSLESFEETPF